MNGNGEYRFYFDLLGKNIIVSHKWYTKNINCLTLLGNAYTRVRLLIFQIHDIRCELVEPVSEMSPPVDGRSGIGKYAAAASYNNGNNMNRPT